MGPSLHLLRRFTVIYETPATSPTWHPQAHQMDPIHHQNARAFYQCKGIFSRIIINYVSQRGEMGQASVCLAESSKRVGKSNQCILGTGRGEAAWYRRLGAGELMSSIIRVGCYPDKAQQGYSRMHWIQRSIPTPKTTNPRFR